MLLIIFAWFFEIFGVLFGGANSLYVTLGDPEVRPWPETVIGYFPTLPLVVLAAGELLRIPFAKAFHMPRSWWFKAIALSAFLGLWGIGIENWTFGLERMVTLRLKPAEDIRVDIRSIEMDIAARKGSEADAAGKLKTAREAAAKRIAELQAQSVTLAERLKQASADNQAEVKAVVERCRYTPANDGCTKKQSDAAMARHKEVTDAILAEQAIVKEALKEANDNLKLANTEAKQQVGGESLDVLTRKLAAKQQKLANEVRDNPIYRIASAWFHVPTEQLSEEQLATAKNFFSLFGAIIITGIAGGAAFIYYAPTKKPWVRNTIRGFLARKRKGVVRIETKEVPVDRVVEKLVAEKEVPVIIRETTVKIVPVRGLTDEQKPFTVDEKITGPEAEAKLRVVRGDKQ